MTTLDLLTIYGRNIDLECFARGWNANDVAKRLGLSLSAFNRIRFARIRYLDPRVLLELSILFNCTFNDLLQRRPGVTYPEPVDAPTTAADTASSIRIDEE